MSEAEPANITEEQPQLEEKEGNAEESEAEKPQSTDGGAAVSTSNTPCPDEEPKEQEDCSANAIGVTQLKMQSIFSQVRNQIRSQVSMDFHKKGILDVVHRVTRERAKENEAQTPSQAKDDKGVEETEGEAEGKKEEEGNSEVEGENDGESAVEETLEGGLAALREELLASIETLRNDFKEEMALLQAEAHEYTDRAIGDLAAKALSTGLEPHKGKHQLVDSSGQQLQPGARTRQKSLSVPSLVPARPRMLNRTMTSLNPKTCQSVVLGPRSKSETLGSPGDNKGSLRLLESSDFHVYATQGRKSNKAGGNLPPPCPALRNNQKLVWGKVRTGNSTKK